MKLGDKIPYKIKITEILGDRTILHPQVTNVQAQVVYIHPKRRFFTIEYAVGGKHLRETLYFAQRGGNEI